MSSLTALLTNIKQVLIDLKNDKVTARARGLENFHNIFDNRSSELNALLKTNTNNRTDDDDDPFTWSELFDGLHNAIKDQCVRIHASKSSQSQNNLISKNDGYKEALRKCINLANEQVPNVSYKKICHAALDCFETSSVRRYFDVLYLQVIHKHILKAKHNIGEISITEWSRLLLQIFKLFDQDHIQRLELLQCIPLILQHGSKYTYLVNDMHQHLPNVIRIVNESQLQLQINAQRQILYIVYEFIRNLAINQRLSIVDFTEQILEKFIKLYQFTMDADSKVVFMKVLHISIVVHSPEPISDDAVICINSTTDHTNDLFTKNVSKNPALWYKHLRNMLSVVEREITDSRKRSNRLNPNPSICPIFVRMAAKLCSVVLWSDDVWTNGSGNDEQQRKRRRHSMQLERICELIEYEPQKFCWRWFAILSQLMFDFPHVLRAEDYQSLLKLLTDFKPKIQYSLHMKCFIRIVKVMLSREDVLKTDSTQILDSFCTKHWHEIMELSLKQAETDKTQLENVDLMRVLIDNRLIVSHDFIKSIITAITKTQTIKKSNNSIRLLISILCNVNTDMIDGIKDIKIAIIQWLSSNIKLSELKKVIENNNNINIHLVSELYVLCVLSRQENTYSKNSKAMDESCEDDFDVREYELFIGELIQSLQYRMLSKLVVSNTINTSKKSDFECVEDLPKRNDVKTYLNETIFGELKNAINHDNSLGDNSIECFNSCGAALMTNVNILNSLISYESMDGETFLKFLPKHIFLKIGTLNSILGHFCDSYSVDHNRSDVNEIIDILSGIWHEKYHPIIAENLFIIKNASSIIKWLEAQLKPSQRGQSKVLLPLKEPNQLEFDERIQYKCFTLLTHFSAYESEHDDLNVFKAIDDYAFNYKRNEDLFIVFQLIKIILNQRCPSKQQIEWAFGELLTICEQLSSHCDYIELVVDHIPNLVKCVKPYNDTDMHDNLITLLSTVLKRCKTKKFGQSITIKALKSVEYFAQEFHDDEDGFTIIAFLKHFLQSEFYSIQMATVSCLTNIFNKNWLNSNRNEVSCLTIQQFHLDLVEHLKIDELSVADENDNDRKTCIASVRLQLYCSIIGMCYALRKEMWFNIIEFSGQQLQLDDENTFKIVEKLCIEVFDSSSSILLDDLVPHLIALWIDRDYLLTRFPVKLSKCSCQNDFLIEYMDTITLRIILYKYEYIPELLRMAQVNSLGDILTTPILIKCLAWLTSVNVSLSASRETKAKAVKILKTLRNEKPRIEDYFDSHSLEIIEELLVNTWDAKKFREFFKTDVEFVMDEHTIDFVTFLKSLEYVQQKSSRSSNVIHHFCKMSPKKVINILYSLRFNLQKSVCEELKLTQMFRLCVLIDIVVDFLIENHNESNHVQVVGFFVRDFMFFFGSTISGSYADKLKLATCKYFRTFCEKILPVCATHFQPHLNYIVSALMPIAKAKPQSEIFESALGLLHFLIADQTNVLKQAIGQLDSFPMQSEFSVLRQIQNDVKYNGKSFSLLDEIEYFLLVDRRKVEGLLSLKEHLSKKKNELHEIYKTIYETGGFSEDCERNPIHRLISALLSHIVQSVDTEKSLVAAKCLAELGPNDLGSIALKFDVQSQTYKICQSFDEAVANLCEHAFDKLNGMFIHGDVTVLQAAAKASQYLLESHAALSFLDNYKYLSVFETGAIRQLPLKQNQQTLNLSQLFNEDVFCKGHSFWVKSLAIELFTFFGAESLAEVAAKQTQFSVAMVPLLIKTLLATKLKSHHNALNEAINVFFSKNFAKLDANSMEVDENVAETKPPVYLDKVSIKLMLNVTECIRIHNQNSTPDDWLKLNYLHTAKAALFCEAYFTAILYCELASCEETTDVSSVEIRSIMKNAFQSIGETDAVSAFLDPIKQKIECLELNRCWDQILIGIDSQTNDVSPYIKYLSEASLYNLANKLSQGSNIRNYECAWRLADWNIIESDDINSTIQNDDIPAKFEKYHYFALKHLQQKDQIGVKINIERAFKVVIKMFKQSSYECTKNIYKNLLMLHLLQQVDDCCRAQFPHTDDENYGPEFVIDKWNYQDQIASCGFSYREPILAQRIILFQSFGVRAKRKIERVYNFDDLLQRMTLNLVIECREEGFFNLGERYSAMLQKMSLSSEIKMKALIEDAQLNWCRGEGEMAQHMINSVIGGNIPTFTRAKAIGMMGEYLAEARLEDTKTIIKSYLTKSVLFSSKVKQSSDSIRPGSTFYYSDDEKERLDLENRKRNYQAIAKYADREYQQIAAYKKSIEFGKKLTNIEKIKTLLNEMRKRSKSLTKDETRSYQLMTKSITIDESDVKSTNMESQEYLHLAIEYYIQTLLLESQNKMSSSSMFRLFGLWFANANNKDILKDIEENYKKIPTHKFIALMPQITAHLSTDGIKDVIHNIILKCAAHHPYHVLPKVFALFNAFKDEEFITDPKQKSKNVSSVPRTNAATKLLHNLRSDGQFRDIIIQMEKMCEVLIRLANTKIESNKEFPSTEPIRHLRDLDLVHCPTVNLPVKMSGDYSQSIIGIHKWSSQFSVATGINAPKRIECIGTNGYQYSQLLKGTDDLRQDAVMQQVFTIMNDMLSKSKITKKDRLHVRTYIIVPLSQRSGILEWCENTMPLTDYLVGSSKRKGAHERFRPQDWPPQECRRKLSQVSIRTTTFEDTYKTYQSVCEHIKPVFHHFFLEHFYNPGVWFERRMAYAHSLATTSMIGYILGIGDRHVSNILIDKTTAELIHIDFGIAFEQGKCLPTPELIPFRLTRDLVSALGPSGVEGVYRKSCEKTMEALRQNKSTILTIVEVLLHDPLYAWTLTSNQASKRQQISVHIDEDQDINTMAERALWRLEEKLDGKHVSRSESISVKRHVEILIKEATNVKLLCKLFVGWQPYL